jgi:hypothetical protein
MRAPSPASRAYTHIFYVLLILWMLWLLQDTDGWRFAITVIFIIGGVAIIVWTEIAYRRGRRTDMSPSEDGSDG